MVRFHAVQAVAVALGGIVGNNPSGDFCFGAESISLDLAHLAQYKWAKRPYADDVSGAVDGPVTLPPMVRLLESHGEQVLRLPPGARLLGGSYTAPHELFLAGEHGNLLCCQAHVEVSSR